MIYEKLNREIEKLQKEIIKTIQECIQIESVKGSEEKDAPYGRGPKEALEYALHLGKTFGLKTKNVDNGAGWVEYGEGEEMVAVLGHLDVVPAGEGWIYPAFKGEIHDNKIFGRGVLDDKGAVIGAIYGLKALKNLGIKTDYRIRVIFGTDEESGCSCIRHYIKVGEEQPIMGFTPDGDYPLIFFEKGMTTLTVGRRKPKLDENILYFQGGIAKNIVSPSCRLILRGKVSIKDNEDVSIEYKDGQTIIDAKGIGAHGSKPQLGKNAVISLLETIKTLEISGDFKKMSDFLLTEIGRETTGKTLGILYEDEETGETTVNLGIVKYNADEMSMTLDIRYPKNAAHEEVLSKVKNVLKKYDMEVLECTNENCLYVPLDSDLVTKLMKVYVEQTGCYDKPMAIGGGTYAKMFKNMVAFGPVFQGMPDIIHQANESVNIDLLIKSIQITTAGMLELATK